MLVMFSHSCYFHDIQVLEVMISSVSYNLLPWPTLSKPRRTPPFHTVVRAERQVGTQPLQAYLLTHLDGFAKVSRFKLGEECQTAWSSWA